MIETLSILSSCFFLQKNTPRKKEEHLFIYEFGRIFRFLIVAKKFNAKAQRQAK
jgi:hypothetical protein